MKRGKDRYREHRFYLKNATYTMRNFTDEESENFMKVIKELRKFAAVLEVEPPRKNPKYWKPNRTR